MNHALSLVLLAVVAILLLAAILWLLFRIYRQWQLPAREHQARLQELQRRKAALGMIDDAPKQTPDDNTR